LSTLRVQNIQNLSGVDEYTAAAWVNFNGTGTVSIRSSGNVSSITDNAVGDYTLNFTTAIADANYAVAGSAGGTGIGVLVRNATAATTSSVRVTTYNASWVTSDYSEVTAIVVR